MTHRLLSKTGALIDYGLAKVRAKLTHQFSSGKTAFKDHHRELQELAREVFVLRYHNLQFKEGEPQDQLLMFAEGAMILVCMERFLRAMLGTAVTNADTLQNLLEKAFSSRRYDRLEVPGGDRSHLIALVVGFRNGLLHGNFEQLARNAGCATNLEYFKHQYPGDLEKLYNILNAMMRQIDIHTGSVYQADLLTRCRARLVDTLSRRTNHRNMVELERAKKIL